MLRQSDHVDAQESIDILDEWNVYFWYSDIRIEIMAGAQRLCSLPTSPVVHEKV